MNINISELASLKLLSDMQAELRDALNELGGRRADGLLEQYAFYTSAHINRAVEGYVYLRESRRVEASKHLIRTVIEAFIRLQCICKHPELLFQIAFTEFKEDKKWARAAKREDLANVMQTIEANWAAFVEAYRKKYPEQSLTEEELSLRGAAEYAGLEGYYDSHYRLYCRFTHVALRASIGGLSVFDVEDNRTMTVCALAAVEALVTLGATAPNLASLKHRFFLSV